MLALSQHISHQAVIAERFHRKGKQHLVKGIRVDLSKLVGGNRSQIDDPDLLIMNGNQREKGVALPSVKTSKRPS